MVGFSNTATPGNKQKEVLFVDQLGYCQVSKTASVTWHSLKPVSFTTSRFLTDKKKNNTITQQISI
jgi:hypothetical protein